MSIITFWDPIREQAGKTLAVTAIATHISIEHNYKLLLVGTGYKDYTIDRCFWAEDKPKKKNFGLFGPNTNTGLEDGMSGLSKLMKSSKLSADQITNYTKPIFKNRLEVLPTFKGAPNEYEQAAQTYPDLLTTANGYYDLVFVDLDTSVGKENAETIIQKSDLIVVTLKQKLSSINNFLQYREDNPMFKTKKALILIGEYDRNSKYNIKNITRYMGEKNKVSTVPYNTLFMEAAEETGVPDLFLKLRKNKNSEDSNGFFLSEVNRSAENIIYRLQDLRMR